MSTEDRRSCYNIVFQDLLFREPLYKFIGADENNMNILVLGWSEAVPSFIDQCFQAGQMRSHSLRMTVAVSEPEKACNEYRGPRPALEEFIDINGSLQGSDKENYGVLNFQKLPDDDSPENDPLDLLMDLIANAPDEKYHYFLVAFEDVERNLIFAKYIGDIVDQWMLGESMIYYMAEENNSNFQYDNIHPVIVPQSPDMQTINPELERMAYNEHLIWANSINGDYKGERDRFKKAENRYNYLSSVASAVSIRYKLAEFGIELGDCEEEFSKAAEAFYNKLENDQDEDILNETIAMEHRRWLIYMTADGYVAPSKYYKNENEFYRACVNSGRCKLKIDEGEDPDGRKIHNCIVRSTTATPLSTSVYAGRAPKYWNNKSENDDALDDLDSMSVHLHRFMKREAGKYDSQFEREVDRILNSGKINEKVLREWQRFLFCIRNIQEGKYGYAKQFDRYQKDFLDTVERYEKSLSKEITETVDKIRIQIWPAVEYDLYRDYKMNDVNIVREIPFIITYRSDLKLARGFSTLNSVNLLNDVVFQNVASATVIKPASIVYLLYLDNNKNTGIVQKMIRVLRQYMSWKGMNCQIEFLVSGSVAISKKLQEEWEKIFRQLKKDNFIDLYDLKFMPSEEDIISCWKEALTERNIDLYEGAEIFQSMSLDGLLYDQFHTLFPYFEFDPGTKTFRNNAKCRYLSYIDDHTYLGIDEMFGLAGATDLDYHYPVMGDQYKVLWSIYTGETRRNRKGTSRQKRTSISDWNIMCDWLSEYDEKYNKPEQIVIDELYKIGEKNLNHDKLEYRWDYIMKILKDLADHRFIIPAMENGELVRFSYADNDAREVLTKAGEILEIHTYFTICERGIFDDVACGYTFAWNPNEQEQVTSELDLICTKGFQSIIIECKGRYQLDQNFYHKLNSVGGMFGIGSHKVLLTTATISDGPNTDNPVPGINALQEKRGMLMDIITISDFQEIESDIVARLNESLDGSVM